MLLPQVFDKRLRELPHPEGTEPASLGTAARFAVSNVLNAVPQLALLPANLFEIAKHAYDARQGDEYPINNMPIHKASEWVSHKADEVSGLSALGIDRLNNESFNPLNEYLGYGITALTPTPSALTAPGASAVSKFINMAIPTTAKIAVPNVAMNAAVPTAISAGVRSLDEKRKASSSDTLTEAEIALPSSMHQTVQVSDPLASAEILPQQQNTDPLASAEVTLPQQPLTDRSIDWIQRQVDDMSNAELYGFGAAATAVLGGVALHKYMRAKQVPQFAGTRPNHEDFTKFINDVPGVDRITGGALADNTAVISNTLKAQAKKQKMSSEQQQQLRDYWDAEIALGTRHGAESRILDAFNTGDLPFSTLRTIPMQAHLDAVHSLSPDKMKLYNDARFAADELDNIATGKTSLQHPGMALPYQRSLNAAMADPEVGALMQQTKRIHAGMLDYAHEQGFLTAQEHLQLKAARQGYMPRFKYENKSWLQKLADGTFPYDDAPTGVNWNPIEERAQNAGLNKVLPAWEADDRAWKRMMMAAQNNATRRNIVDRMVQLQGGVTKKQLQGRADVLLRASKADIEKSPNEITQIWRNGKAEHYKWSSPELATAMKFAPNLSGGVLDATGRLMRRAAQETTTHPLVKPLFTVLRAPLLDTNVAQIFKNERLTYGLIQQAVKNVTGKNVNVFDPTIYPMVGAAAAYNLVMRSAQAVHTSYIKALTKNQTLNALGQTQQGAVFLEGLRKSISEAYLKSMYRELQREGVMLSQTLKDQQHSLIDQIPVLGHIARPLHAIGDAIGTANQTAIAAQNLRKGMSDAARKNVLRDVKDLYGDFTRTSANPVTKFIGNHVMYGNVTSRANSLALRRFKQQPVHTLTGMLTTGVGLSLAARHLWSQLSPEMQQAYNDLPESDRASAAIIPLDSSDPSKRLHVPIDPSAQPLVSFMTEALDKSLGLSNMYMDPGNAFKQGISHMLGGYLNLPAIQQAAALQGYKLTGDNIMEYALGLRDDSALKLADKSSMHSIADQGKMFINGDLTQTQYNLMTAILHVAGEVAADMYEGGHQKDGSFKLKPAAREFVNTYTRSSVLPNSVYESPELRRKTRAVLDQLHAIDQQAGIDRHKIDAAVQLTTQQSGVQAGELPDTTTDSQLFADIQRIPEWRVFMQPQLDKLQQHRMLRESVMSKRGDPGQRMHDVNHLNMLINQDHRQILDAVKSIENRFGKTFDAIINEARMQK